MTHTITHNSQNLHHFYVGTPGILALHTPNRVKEGDTITIGPRSVIVLKIRQHVDSSTFKGLQFYDLTFKDVEK